MTDSIDLLFTRRWELFADEVRSLLSCLCCNLGTAKPPRKPGVYVLFDEFSALTYVGIAANLSDRFLKHVSGDESHAIQRALALRFPDRSERRSFIKTNVQAKWLVVADEIRRSDLERLLIWLYQPIWNRR